MPTNSAFAVWFVECVCVCVRFFIDHFPVFLCLENGIKAEEQGEVKNKGTDNEIQSVRGSYSYTGPDGVLYTVTYIADENGLLHIY